MIERDYVKYALENYRAPLFSLEEFNEDLNKVIVIKKMFRRYTNSESLNERLILNNIILILNQFGVKVANEMLFYKVNREHHGVLKTFLVYLNSFSENEFVDDFSDLDPIVVSKLKDITCRSCLSY